MKFVDDDDDDDIVQILDTLHFSAPPPSVGIGTMYGVQFGLTGKHIVDFLLVLIELFFAGCYG